jgi:hypothetical protein
MFYRYCGRPIEKSGNVYLILPGILKPGQSEIGYCPDSPERVHKPNEQQGDT